MSSETASLSSNAITHPDLLGDAVSAAASAHAGFWLDDVGCAPMALDATLLAAARPLHVYADLGFQCDE